MTDTHESNYQDLADLRAERDALRASNDSLVRECHEFAKHLAEARKELAALRKEAAATAVPSERYEALAEAFQRETGHWPPGKDRPAAMGGHDMKAAREAWDAWIETRCAQRVAPPSVALREAARDLCGEAANAIVRR